MRTSTLALLFMPFAAILVVACSTVSPPAPEMAAGEATRTPTVRPSASPVPSATPLATVTVAATVTATRPAPADLRFLQAAIEETLAEFSGISSYVVVDLASGQRIARNEDVALAGMSLIKVPILINTYAVLDNPPDVEQTKLITQTTALSSNFAANLLLQTIAGKRDAYAGADLVTGSLRDLGIYNTFIAVPIDADPRPERLNTYLTPANQRTDITTHADPYRQTTTGDLAGLLEMIYKCAEEDAGPLRALYGPRLTAAECQEMLAMMQMNELARLLENGLPEGVPFAHKVGWIDDTHGDGGIVFSPGGDYILVMALFAPEWLEWADSAPLFARVAEQAYAHFNDPLAYEGQSLAPLPTSPAATPTVALPHAIVTDTGGVGLTIRETPGGAEVAIVPEGTVLTLLPRETLESGGFTWHWVRTPAGAEGWAASAFFTLWQE